MLAAIGEPRKGKNEQKPKISFTHRQFLLCRLDGHAGRNEETNESGGWKYALLRTEGLVRMKRRISGERLRTIDANAYKRRSSNFTVEDFYLS